MMMDLFINLMIAQALMGAFDTLYHHEFKVALPQCVNASLELSIHAVRAVLYSVVFMGLAWYEWGGIWAWLLIAIILIEVGLTLWDFVIEDSSRMLPMSERITHTLLAINGGAMFILLAIEMQGWVGRESSFILIDYDWRSEFLSVAAIGVGVSGIRDGLAAWGVRRLDLKLGLDLGGHKKIVISGGTGFIGSALVRELLHGGHEITVITRQPLATAVQFSGKVRALKSASEINADDACDVIINLAGAPVVGMPWSRKRRALIEQSRFSITEDLMAYVKRSKRRPKTWLQASAIGYYGLDSQRVMDESSPEGEGFAAGLCSQWEQLTDELEALSVRRVVLRFGLVFGRSGGSLPAMLMSFRFGAGAIIGSGKQIVSWIHIEDLLHVIAMSIRESSITGAINVIAPDGPTYSQFAHAAGKQLQRPVLFRIPARLLSVMLGEMATMFIEGPGIVPGQLQKLKYQYHFPDLRRALMDLS